MYVWRLGINDYFSMGLCTLVIFFQNLILQSLFLNLSFPVQGRTHPIPRNVACDFSQLFIQFSTSLISFPLGWQLRLAQRSRVYLCSQLINLKPCFRLVNNLKLGTNRFSFSSVFVPENFWTFLESLGIESVQSSVSVKWPSECCVTDSYHLSHSLTKFLELAHVQLKGVSATM